jgi:hypothetical protein
MPAQDQQGQIRVPIDIIGDEPANSSTPWRKQFAATVGWHLRWKYQQMSTIMVAVSQALDSVALAVIRLVYALGSYGIVGTLIWKWLVVPAAAHHHPDFQSFVAIAMAVALVAMLIGTVNAVFSEWNWHEPKDNASTTRPSRHTGDDHKDDALDHLHVKIVTAGYRAFFYGFPWAILGLAWVATIL